MTRLRATTGYPSGESMMTRASTRRDFIIHSAAAGALLACGRTFAQPSDLADLTIEDAAGLIRARSISPVELAQTYLERIDDIDRRLNTFITVTDDLALRQAREMEAELSNGRWRGPLHGIPVALKDNIDTAGILTTAASAAYADRVPTEDAEVVRRLKSAGAVLLGKLNMHELAYGGTSAVTHYDPVHNPWDLDRIPGGSSGGSAAAVSARLCAGALGTDTAGSVRIPAAFCGIVGFKPTYGLSSIRGIIPLGVSLDHVGPMCRTVGDAALMLQVIAGYDSRDIPSIRVPIPDYSSALYQRTSHLRLGVPRELFYEDVDEQVLDSVERALVVLGSMTMSTRDVELPMFSGVSPTQIEAYVFHAEYLEERRDLYEPGILRRLLAGAEASAPDYVRARHSLALARRAIGEVFEEVDLLVTPTTPILPGPIPGAHDESVNAGPGLAPRNTRPFNYYGIPTISVPCGFSREGLPIGLQISGPRLGELDVLALAHAYEQATDWHTQRPSVA